MKKALITGIIGQDDAYLARFLLYKGYLTDSKDFYFHKGEGDIRWDAPVSYGLARYFTDSFLQGRNSFAF